MKKSDYVWYASYGSNLLEKRFLCYIKGGQIEGSSRVESGCQDSSDPLESRPYIIKRELFFAGHAKKWEGKGVAYINPVRDENAMTYGRMYLITREQFLDVVRQENAIAMDTKLSIPWIMGRKGRVILPKRKYGRLLCLGKEDGYPVYTFTCIDSMEKQEFNEPSEGYLSVIGRGIMETYGLPEEEVRSYFDGRIR